MSFLKTPRGRAVAFIILTLVVIGASIVYFTTKPLPVYTEFKSRYFSFEYPRQYTAEEYAPGVVSLGAEDDDIFNPLVEVTRYQSDPESALPKTFDLFVRQQAVALCGADGSTESISCTGATSTVYTSAMGAQGQKLDLKLVRKNLRTGTTTSSTYGPFYIFNTTEMSSSTPKEEMRYSAIFVYPSLAAFNTGTTTPALMDKVISTFVLGK